jgi:WD40 repeat protein
MAEHGPCPDPGRWRQLLDGCLADEEQSALGAHLEACPGCQRTLDELAADSAAWSRAARHLAGARPDGTALRRLLAGLGAEAGPAATRAEPHPGAAQALDFLSPPRQPGELGRLGPYAVREVLGRGGMGVVLKAFDEALQRVVAVKVMAPQLATSAAARQRFVREARAAAAVRHEHVIDIHAVEEAKGLPYLVMEYVAGVSLQERLDRTGPLEPKEVLRIGAQVAAGLAAAHAQGLIHRDVKPANILLENGVERVKLTDFGLARAADDASLTQSGVVAGTPPYMAPEQARGEAVDHRADLFSLGSVLYALCTGCPPFRAGGSMAVLKRVCEDTPRPIQESNPEVPGWLVEIIARLHAKDPAERFASAAAVGELLSKHLARLQQPGPETMPVRPARASGTTLRQRPARRRWAVAAAVLLVLLGGSLGLGEATGVTRVAATVLRICTPDGTLVVKVDDPGVKVTIEGDGGLVIAGAGPQEVRLRPGSYHFRASKDGQPLQEEVVTISRGDRQVVTVAVEASGGARPTPAFQFRPPPPGPLDRLDPARIPPAERFPRQPPELVAVLGEHRQRHWAPVNAVVWSADAKRVASGGWDYVIRVWDADTMRERAVLRGHTREVQSVALSRDGRHLLSGGWDETVRWWDVDTGQELRRLGGHGQVEGVALSPDERRALSGHHDKTVRLWDLDTGQELRRFEGHTYSVGGVAFSADGRRALSGGFDHAVRVWDVESGKPLHRLEGHPGMVRAVAFSPDGRLALSGNLQPTGGYNHASDYDLRLWDVESGQEVRRFRGHTSLVEGVTFSPDGRQALSCGDDGTLRLWEVGTGNELGRFEGNAGWVRGVAFSPDGRRAVSGGADGTVRVWDVATGKESCPVTGPTSPTYQVAFSADGGHLLAAGGDRVVRLWDIASGKEPRLFEGHTDPVISVALSPDGCRALSASSVMSPWGAQPDNGDRTGGPWRLWDVQTGKEFRRFLGPSTDGAGCVAFSPDGKLALTGCRFQVLLWDVETGRELRRLDGHKGYVATVAFAPDGRRALSGCWDGEGRLWDIGSGKLLYRFRREQMGGIYSVAFAPDGRHAVAGTVGGGIVELYDLDADQPQARFFFKRHTDKVKSVAFGPDGTRLASAGDDGRIILWDAAAGDKLREWQLPGPVHGIAFARDGRHLAAANGNGTVYLLRLAKP